jgi:hypothetical protein
MATYNRHKNWTHWNVSLWINNDAAIYEQAWQCAKSSPSLDHAAHELLAWLPEKTPDGARYTFTSVRAALRGIL